MKLLSRTWLCMLFLGALAAATPTLRVEAGRPGARISTTMWGLFFEDINFGADGGVYAELVKNRSFEFPSALMGWKELRRGPAEGKLEILDLEPCNASNPHYLRIQMKGSGAFGAANDGFRGMGVKQGEPYDLSLQMRGDAAIHVELVAPDGRVLARAALDKAGKNWKSRRVSLVPVATEAKASLVLLVEGTGAVDVDQVSLFPRHTWKDRSGGLRADLVQLLADMKPGVLRFPGGCIVEGHTLSNRYSWKATLGKPEDRKLLLNRWNDEFKHRPAPDYFQSFGLGFFEYFQLCEDIGAQPLPILNCGMACQFNSGELVPMDQLDPYIQDALDLIEFANGPANSTWGAKRAAMGHVEPFHMKLLGVGNEQWGPQYFERYERFASALKKSHPEIQLISSAGPSPSDANFQLAWKRLREPKADIVDEHCYDKPEWFYKEATRFDAYDRTGPKVFMGEYAAQNVGTCSPENRNVWATALAEAAFMTGLERNADVVVMSSYAPLFAHAEAWQWTPNLIWFDNLRTCPTANYWVQYLFSRNRGDVVLPATVPGESRLFVTASRQDEGKEIILKVVNASERSIEVTVDLQGALPVGSGQVIVLAGKPAGENTLDEPRRIVPVTVPLKLAAPEFPWVFPASSLTVLRIPVR